MRAVHAALYRSPAQRGWRAAAGTLLVCKHALRGMLFSWPLYLLLIAGLIAPWPEAGWLLAVALPGLLVSSYILLRGVHDDYCRLVHGEVLRSRSLLLILRPRH